MHRVVARWLAAAAGFVGAISASVAGAPAVFAGSNGQHLDIHTGARTYSVAIYGTNQYGNFTKTAINTPTPWTYQSWWWKYTTNFYSFSGPVVSGRTSGTYLGHYSKWVPKTQSSNYVKVYAV
jgi:hypothetical protein